ncbi:LLM class F420-dependent oxidoreductase [Sciscionella marina]|uniref:LLM class F420-dependent oxidoreductase n=1 Tax=Sciscionella marina TaxID=508770 RepID=UPI00047674D3|nr:LLM class F420-dependent oxidoreductase [Sciscionella marina]
MAVRMGVNTPIVLHVPDRNSEWEQTAGIAEVVRIAERADELGYDFLTCSDHVGVPQGSPSPMMGGMRGTRYWDPLATLSYLAARTRGIRLCTNVLVLGYHHPLAIAKRFGTLDMLSGGRLILGVGVGSTAEEFAVLGAPFDDRGPRADDAIGALRAAMSERLPSYDGRYYRFSGLVIEPHAVQREVPIWVGGNTRRSVRRATELADGWLPAALSPEQLRTRLEQHPPSGPRFEVVVSTTEALDPVGDPDGALRTVTALEEAGATTVLPRLLHHSEQHYLEGLQALAELSCFVPRP